MTSLTFGLVTSIFTLGGGIGSLAAGPLSTRYGRLLTMRLSTIFFVLGPLLESVAANVPVLSAGRFLSGIGAGVAIVVAPVYIAEVAPAEGKGLFGALTQVMINFGIFGTQLLGLFWSTGQLWRLIFGVGGATGIVQLLGLFAVPETPRWLSLHGQPQTAIKVLTRIRGDGADLGEETRGWAVDADENDAAQEAEALLGAHPSTGDGLASGSKNPSIGIFVILRLSHYRPALIAVVGAMLAQQLCGQSSTFPPSLALLLTGCTLGINSIVMYSVSLLSPILHTHAAILTVVVSAINLFTTILFAPLADRLGRRPCLLLSILGMGSMSLCLALSIMFALPIVSAIAVLLFVASFAVGLGPVPFILASELVGPEAVGATQSWALVANWTATFLVAQFFPKLNRVLGSAIVYFLFAGLAALFFGFVWWWVPETRDKKDADEVWGREPTHVD